MFRFVDAYTLRARLVPAAIAAAPALAAIALLISWNKIALSNMIATGHCLCCCSRWQILLGGKASGLSRYSIRKWEESPQLL